MGSDSHNNDLKRYINDNTSYCNAFSALMGTKDSSVPVLAAVLATRYSRLVLLASWAGASSKRTCPQPPPSHRSGCSSCLRGTATRIGDGMVG